MLHTRILTARALVLLATSLAVVAACSSSSSPSQQGGAQEQKSIGPEGGTLTTSAGVVVEVPPGAVDAPTVFTVTKVAGTAPIPGTNVLGDAYELGPAGQKFKQPIKVTLPLPAGAPDTNVAMVRLPSDSSEWLPIGGADKGKAAVVGYTRSFSTFELVQMVFEQARCFVPTNCSITCGGSACDGSCSIRGTSITAGATCTPSGDRIACTCDSGNTGLVSHQSPSLFIDWADLFNPAAALYMIASRCGWPCSTQGAGDGGAGDAGGADGGGGTVQTLFTTTEMYGIGHLAMLGNTIFYGVPYPYTTPMVTVGSVNTDGTNPTIVIPTNDPQQNPKPVLAGIAAAGGKVYYASGNGVLGNLYSVATTGGTVSDLGSIGYVSTTTWGTSLLASDGTSLFFANCEGNGGMSNIKSLDLGGNPIGTLSTGIHNACAVASDGQNAYAGVFENILKAPVSLASTASIAGPTEFKIGTFTPVTVAVTTDATDVYWAAVDNAMKKGAIFRKNKGGTGAVTRIATADSLVYGLAVDASYVYYVACGSSGQGGGTCNLTRAPRTATDSTGEVLGPANPFDILVDANAIYYGEGKMIRRRSK